MKPSECQRVAIVGSRPGGVDAVHKDRARRAAVRERVAELPRGTVVVSGGANGVDCWAEERALESGLVVVRCIPPWGAMDKREAARLRNEALVAIADRVIAFWDGWSRGTAMTIDIARKAGKPLEVIRG